MEFSPVLPIPFYPQVDHGTVHFVQAHLLKPLIDEGDVEYVNWFKERGVYNAYHTVILDNGCIELGEPDMESLVAVANRIEPDIVICPDMLSDSTTTRNLYKEYSDVVRLLAPTMMVVPQGETVEEWVSCAKVLLAWDNAANDALGRCAIGVPKILDSYPGGREYALAWLQYYLSDISQYYVHLLGIHEDVGELRNISKFSWLDSVDSTLPFAHAYNGQHTSIRTPKYPTTNDMLLLHNRTGRDVYDFDAVRRLTEVNASWISARTKFYMQTAALAL
jgi:hypothetical protein